MINYIFFLLVGFINFLFIYNYKKISILYNLFDYPNEERKKQSFPIPLLGGIYFLLNFILYCFYELYLGNDNFFYSLGFNNNINILVFITSVLLVFFLGFIDDKMDLKPLSKIVIIIFLLYIFFISNEKININSLNFSSFGKNIDLYHLGLPFSILCVVILINALNMMDGIDGISIMYFVAIFSTFVFFNFYQNFSLIMLIALFGFAFLNFKGKAYLGDSGVYLLSFITSIFLISFYEENNLSVENILLMIFLPIIDFFRLVVARIYRNKSPFLGDSNHFHHFLTSKFSKIKSYMVLTLFIYLPIFLSLFLEINETLLLFVMILIYFSFFYFLKKIN